MCRRKTAQKYFTDVLDYNVCMKQIWIFLMKNENNLSIIANDLINTDYFITTLAYKAVYLTMIGVAVATLVTIFQLSLALFNSEPIKWGQYLTYFLWAYATVIPIQICLAISEAVSIYKIFRRNDLSLHATGTSVRKDAILVRFSNLSHNLVNAITVAVVIILIGNYGLELESFINPMNELTNGTLLISYSSLLIFGLCSLGFGVLTVFSVKKNYYSDQFKTKYAVSE